MEKTFLENLKLENNITLTENNALTHKTTTNDCLDFFALGASMRSRSDLDIIKLFFNAYSEDSLITLKLLFYMRDIRNGQGEKRLFRTIISHLAYYKPSIIIKNISNIIKFGRWDDLFYLLDTPCEEHALEYIKNQFEKDLNSKNPSLLAKWLPSENASSINTKKLGKEIRKYLDLSTKEYRKSLSSLRKKINIVETLMSQKRWDEIQYDKLPSKAGLKYREAFYRNDFDRYHDFIENKNKTNKVNARTLYPYEIIKILLNNYKIEEAKANLMQMYWDNLKDYFNGKDYNALCVVDTSGSMYGRPLEVAISLGIYTAQRAKGPYQNHFITFSNTPELVELKGNTLYEQVINMSNANWNMNTNIEAVFDLLLTTALRNKCSQDELPQNIIIISDMEFDDAIRERSWYSRKTNVQNNKPINTLLEDIMFKWQEVGYEMPHLIFWNVDARQNNIPVLGHGKISYVSGFSPAIFEAVLSNKSGYELMMEVVNNKRYDCITL